LGKKVKLEVEQGDQRQAGRHGAVSEFGERIIEKKDLAPDVLAARGDIAGAEAHFTEAIEIAQGQGAKHWELRAPPALPGSGA
jgi:hypothetical protein